MGFCLWAQKVHNISWCEPLWGAIVAAILSALALGLIQEKYKERSDALISSIWSIGMAFGILFISLTPGSTGDLMSFLFGNILWVDQKDLISLVILNIILLIFLKKYFRPLLAICFDEDLAKLQKINVLKISLILLCLIGISIVLLIQVVGTILVLSLLTLPAMIASIYTSRLYTMMLLSTVIAGALNLAGLEISYILNWPPGATITLLAGAGYVTALLTGQNSKKNL